jgi:hypothetical protein
MTHQQIEMLGLIESNQHLLNNIDQDEYIKLAEKSDDYRLSDGEEEKLSKLFIKVNRRKLVYTRMSNY